MAKRKHEDISNENPLEKYLDKRHEHFIGNSDVIINTSVKRFHSVVENQGSNKTSKNSNAFHVDALLSNKYSRGEKIRVEDLERSGVVSPKVQAYSTQFPPYIAQVKHFSRTNDYFLPSPNRCSQSPTYSPPPTFYSPPPTFYSPSPPNKYLVSASPDVLSLLNQKIKCTKPCCVPRQSAYLTNIHAYRSRESGSADSAGSSCNSLETVETPSPSFEMKSRKQVIYSKLYGYTRNEDLPLYNRRKDLECDERELMYYPSESRRLNCTSYDRRFIDQGKCTCPECTVNELVPRSRYISTRSSMNTEPHYERLSPTRHLSFDKETPLSKRRAFINELEAQVTSTPTDNDESKTSIKIKQEPDHDEHSASSDEKNAKNNELLKLPPSGPGRNRALANLLERRRVAELNTAFEKLRVLIPCYGNENRALSKIKTLKYTLTYMVHLMKILDEQTVLGYFHMDRDLQRLSRENPLMKKCISHMLTKNIF